MKRRTFLSTTGLTAAGSVTAFSNTTQQATAQQIIEHRIYDARRGRVNTIAEYFGSALIPAYNRMGIQTVGVFQEYGMSEPPKVHVVVPFPSMESYLQANQQLQRDEEFLGMGKDFIYAEEVNKSYHRFHCDLHLAFAGFPNLVAPAQSNRIFELRIYQGYNEDAVRRKVKMFNVEEIELFHEVNLTPVFFGHGLAGINLPKLTYMLVFDDMEQRDAAWADFIQHPEWARMSKLPEYANTVSEIERTFLVPMDVSQV